MKNTLAILPSSIEHDHIMGSNQIEERHAPAITILPQGTIVNIKYAIYVPNATSKFINFKDIRENRYYIHTNKKNDQEVLHIVLSTPNGTEIKEIIFAYSLGPMSHNCNPSTWHTKILFKTWHN
jgi:hypothetical protein